MITYYLNFVNHNGQPFTTDKNKAAGKTQRLFTNKLGLFLHESDEASGKSNLRRINFLLLKEIIQVLNGDIIGSLLVKAIYTDDFLASVKPLHEKFIRF